MNAAKFQIFHGKDLQFYFRLLTKDGENNLRSEGYTQRKSAEGGIDSVRSNCSALAQYNLSEAGNGFHFSLKARNNEIIGQGGPYPSEAARHDAIKLIIEGAPMAAVVDLTLEEEAPKA